MRRLTGEDPPWTDDPVLAAHRFTNVYRAADRVSQFLIRHVIYAGSQAIDEVFFRTLLFKLFNRIETWKKLCAELGVPSWREFKFERYAGVLDRHHASGARVYSAAYIMPSPPFGDVRKHRNHLRLLEYLMRERVPERIAKCRSLEQVFFTLRSYPSLGDFLAFQLAIDLNYSEMTNFSEMDFVVAGPGAKSGIAKCFADAGGLAEAEIIRVMTDIADSEFERLGLRFASLCGRRLQLIDCQNLFCEVDKYARVVHPDAIVPSSRTRIKQRFTPSAEPLDQQWYPPKWNLEVPSLPDAEAVAQRRDRRSHARRRSLSAV